VSAGILKLSAKKNQACATRWRNVVMLQDVATWESGRQRRGWQFDTNDNLRIEYSWRAHFANERNRNLGIVCDLRWIAAASPLTGSGCTIELLLLGSVNQAFGTCVETLSWNYLFEICRPP